MFIYPYLSVKNLCFGCSKEHWDRSYEYAQHLVWWRNKKTDFIWGPDINNYDRRGSGWGIMISE